MTATYQPEIERKYEVPAGAAPQWEDLPRLTVEAEPGLRSLEAAYFDTPSGRLRAFGVALRRRRGGPDEGWHLKFQEDGLKREVRVPLLKTADRMPAEMRQLISGLIAGEELKPLAVIRNERRVLHAVDPEMGRVAEICLDDVRGTSSADGLTRRWLEHEVELVNGTGADGQAVLEEIEAVLLAGGLLRSRSAAKIARTLGEEDDAETVTLLGPDGEPVIEPEAEDAEAADASTSKKKKKGKDKGKKKDSKGKKGQKDKKDKKSTKGKDGKKDQEPAAAGDEPDDGRDGSAQAAEPSLEDAVRSLTSATVDEILWADFLVRIGAEGGVYRLRRAARRCEAMISGLLPELADEQAAQEAAATAQGISQRLSAARDAEVVRELLPQRAAAAGSAVSRSAVAHLSSLAKEHDEAQAASARRALLGTAHRAQLASLSSWVSELRLTPEAAELSPKKLGRRMLDRWLAPVLELGPVPPETLELSEVLDHVHLVRRALRLASFASGVFDSTPLRAGKSRAAVLDGIQGYLDACGDLMDSRVMDTWYASAARSLARTGGDRYGVGVLHGRERALLEAQCQDSILLLDELFEALEGQD